MQSLSERWKVIGDHRRLLYTQPRLNLLRRCFPQPSSAKDLPQTVHGLRSKKCLLAIHTLTVQPLVVRIDTSTPVCNELIRGLET